MLVTIGAQRVNKRQERMKEEIESLIHGLFQGRHLIGQLEWCHNFRLLTWKQQKKTSATWVRTNNKFK